MLLCCGRAAEIVVQANVLMYASLSELNWSSVVSASHPRSFRGHLRVFIFRSSVLPLFRSSVVPSFRRSVVPLFPPVPDWSRA